MRYVWHIVGFSGLVLAVAWMAGPSLTNFLILLGAWLLMLLVKWEADRAKRS